MKPINLQLTPEHLDFIVKRMTAGNMDYQTAMNTHQLLSLIEKQANDPAIQVLVPATPPAIKEVSHDSDGTNG